MESLISYNESIYSSSPREFRNKSPISLRLGSPLSIESSNSDLSYFSQRINTDATTPGSWNNSCISPFSQWNEGDSLYERKNVLNRYDSYQQGIFEDKDQSNIIRDNTNSLYSNRNSSNLKNNNIQIDSKSRFIGNDSWKRNSKFSENKKDLQLNQKQKNHTNKYRFAQSDLSNREKETNREISYHDTARNEIRRNKYRDREIMKKIINMEKREAKKLKKRGIEIENNIQTPSTFIKVNVAS